MFDYTLLKSSIEEEDLNVILVLLFLMALTYQTH